MDQFNGVTEQAGIQDAGPGCMFLVPINTALAFNLRRGGMRDVSPTGRYEPAREMDQGRPVNPWLQTKLYPCAACQELLLHDKMYLHALFNCPERRRPRPQAAKTKT